MPTGRSPTPATRPARSAARHRSRPSGPGRAAPARPLDAHDQAQKHPLAGPLSDRCRLHRSAVTPTPRQPPAHGEDLLHPCDAARVRQCPTTSTPREGHTPWDHQYDSDMDEGELTRSGLRRRRRPVRRSRPSRSAPRSAVAPVTPTTKPATDTMRSLAPSTAGADQPLGGPRLRAVLRARRRPPPRRHRAAPDAVAGTGDRRGRRRSRAGGGGVAPGSAVVTPPCGRAADHRRHARPRRHLPRRPPLRSRRS